MSLHSQEAFIKEIHPFDKLTKNELNSVIKNIAIAYYPKESILISETKISDSFFMIIKGEVNEYNNDELTFTYHKQDTFDADSLIYHKTKSRFEVTEDLICYELKKEIFLQLMKENKAFGKFFLKTLSERLQTLKNKEYGSDISSFMFAKVSDLYIHKPCIVEPTTSIEDAVRKSMEDTTSTIIVKNGDEYGVVTDTILKKELLLSKKRLDLPILEIAKFPFISVKKDDFLFSVLLTIVKHNIKRVGVMENGEIIGLLKQADILSYFSNHSHIVAMKIARATTIEELMHASKDMNKTIKLLYSKSLKTEYIAQMVAELNSKIYTKLFDFVFPKELQDKCALLVMGSEGRDEQIIKTDQDNALIISNTEDPATFYPYAEIFTEKLISFGFPRCEGNIMVSNPYWCKTEKEFEQQVEKWSAGSNMEDYMNLAIFFDAKCVAGDCSLFTKVENKLFETVGQRDVFLAFFAKATLAFKTPIGIFSSLEDIIDIKKGGIFAIVQGVRSLALENNIQENRTMDRIKALKKLNVIEEELACELVEVCGVLSRLRLQTHINRLKEDKPIDNLVDVSSLSKIERDMLKDSFIIVNKFKKFISHHFHLDGLN
ncbi:MAG: Predicted signal-transduction protein containing cAMP-binding and CBS domains [uncultured Sulfurovum sp.]|uniref:Predicted signal-transduction protein containing cAMP-binding and CBS domains n=1 Tax=uncultured Sulfurovum sp. TaxID=269237 RepID=A0A6S6RSQ4_9BACT|nr:MAG: Predicted signal-transduction protein containing cAMP-binding and CBS domains [uncultured Sulfurovum sp.]